MTPSLSSEIVSSLESDILSGSLTPGKRLPSEEKLCAKFATSRTAVREAIQQLRGRGLIRTLKGSGSYIAEPSLKNLAGAVETFSVLSQDAPFLELMDFRILLETECARLAARRADEQIIIFLNDALHKMAQAKDDSHAFSRADIAFHLAIAAGSRHNLYATVLSALEKRSIEYALINRAKSQCHESLIKAHREIYDAIKERDPDKASAAMKRHLIHSRLQYLELEPRP